MRRWTGGPSASTSRLRASVLVRAALRDAEVAAAQGGGAAAGSDTPAEALALDRSEHVARLQLERRVVPDAWVARFREDVPPAECVRLQRQLAAHLGGQPGAVQPAHCHTACVRGASANAGGEAAGACALPEALAGRVEAIEPDLRVSACRQLMPWGIVRAQGIAARTRFPVFANADVFVFDTGVQRRHPDLRVASAVSCVAHERTPEDLNGHGTAVAGVIAALDNRRDVVGMAPGARIHSVKVLDRTGGGFLSDILTGIEYMIAWKRRHARRVRNRVVANFSLAAYTGSEAYTALDWAIARAVREGITCVVAAGNEGVDARLLTPAHCREAVTVGAIDAANRFAPFSNHGPAVDLLAPGVAVPTTFLNNRVVRISGTSFAAPHVAGAALVHLIRRAGWPTPHQTAARLRNTARWHCPRNRRPAAVPAHTPNTALNARFM